MLSEDVITLCKMNAAMVRVEAMKAENYNRESKGFSQAYGEDQFNYEANFIDELWRK